MKELLFCFKIDSSKSLEDNLGDFKKITVNLANIGEKIDDENQAVIILNSFPNCDQDIEAAIKYGKESSNLVDVLGALHFRDLKMISQKRNIIEALQNKEGTKCRGKL